MQLKIMVYDREKNPLGVQWLPSNTPQFIGSLLKMEDAEWFVITIEEKGFL